MMRKRSRGNEVALVESLKYTIHTVDLYIHWHHWNLQAVMIVVAVDVDAGMIG